MSFYPCFYIRCSCKYQVSSEKNAGDFVPALYPSSGTINRLKTDESFLSHDMRRTP